MGLAQNNQLDFVMPDLQVALLGLIRGRCSSNDLALGDCLSYVLGRSISLRHLHSHTYISLPLCINCKHLYFLHEKFASPLDYQAFD